MSLWHVGVFFTIVGQHTLHVEPCQPTSSHEQVEVGKSDFSVTDMILRGGPALALDACSFLGEGFALPQTPYPHGTSHPLLSLLDLLEKEEALAPPPTKFCPPPEAANANVPARPIAVLPVRTAIRAVRPVVVGWCGLPCRLRCPPNSAPCPNLWRPLGNPTRPHRFGLHPAPFRELQQNANDLQELWPTRACARRID